jgi:hypothetical protein
MPLVECPTCHYRSPVRTDMLHSYAQCLRCTTRFIPEMRQSSWNVGGVLAAAGGVLVVSLVAAALIMLRSS